MIAVILLAVASIYLYRNIDSQLKIFVQNKLTQKLPGFVSEIDSAHMIPSKGIVLRGLVISAPGKFGKPEQILNIQEAFIACDVELQAILSGKVQPKAIVLRKLTLNLTRDENGQFLGLEQLKSVQSSDEPCPIEICESDVIYRDLQKPGAVPLLFSGLNFSLTPPARKNDNWEISGKMVDPKVGNIECTARVSPETKNFTISGNVTKFIVDQDYLPYLPSFSIYEKPLQSFDAKLDFHFEAERDGRKNEQLPFATAFHIQGTLYDGKMIFPLVVKHPISDIRFGFDITHDSVQITDMSAASGESHMKLDWQQTGLFPIRQGRLGYQVEQFRFDKQFLPSMTPYLPERLTEQLENFEAEGQADLNGVVHFDGRRWGIESAVFQLSNLSIVYKKFPYLLDYLNGTIAIAPREMQAPDGRRFFEEAVSLRLETPDKQRIVDGTLYQIMSGHSFGKFEITAQNVAIDEKLKRAIPPAQQGIVQSLNADGHIDGNIKIAFPGSVKQGDDEPSPDLLVHVVPLNCSMKYEKFGYPLRNVVGVIKMDNGHWTFSSLRAENGGSVIMGSGHLLPHESGGVEFRLDLASKGLKLNDELIGAFEKDSHRQLLTDLNFSGRADVNLTVRYLSETQDFHIAFDAETDPKVTTLKPAAFPLPLEAVTCHVRYDDGTVLVEDFRSRKGDAFLSTDLRCIFREDGGWIMSLENLLAERFEHDTELIRAMPADLQGFVSKLQIKEPVTLRGTLCFQKDAQADSPLRSYWDVGVICHQNSAMMGVPLTNICGKVNLLGKNDEGGNTVFGRLELDSVNYGDYQMTNVRGPFSFHDDTITLGRGSLLPELAASQPAYQQTSLSTSAEFAPMATTMQPALIQPDMPQNAVATLQLTHNTNDPSRPWLLSLTVAPDRFEDKPISAVAYDGELRLEGRIFQGETTAAGTTTSYRLHTGLQNINLERATRETLAEHPFKGKLSGDIRLEGGMTRETMKGTGELALREADIYKLPTMQRIMQMFRVRSPGDDQSAICSSDVTFSLQGNRVKLSDVKLDGNVLSLTGTGEMNLETMALNMELGTQLASSESQMPVLSNVINETSRKITRIYVGGSLKSGDLSVRTQALPDVVRALQTQQDGQQNTSRPVRDFFKNPLRSN